MCVYLCNLEMKTYTSVLDWFDIPILELIDWLDTLIKINDQSKKNKRK